MHAGADAPEIGQLRSGAYVSHPLTTHTKRATPSPSPSPSPGPHAAVGGLSRPASMLDVTRAGASPAPLPRVASTGRLTSAPRAEPWVPTNNGERRNSILEGRAALFNKMGSEHYPVVRLL